MSTVLHRLLNRTFALLLEDENNGDNCERLVENLDRRIDRSGIKGELKESACKLKSAVESLLPCVDDCLLVRCGPKGLYATKTDNSLTDSPNKKNDIPESNNAYERGIAKENDHKILESDAGQANIERSTRNKTKQPNDNDSPHEQLRKVVQEIKDSDEFKKVVKKFQKSNKISTNVFTGNSEVGAKITATKIRVISEILGNLTNVRTAAENCRKYVVQLYRLKPFPSYERYEKVLFGAPKDMNCKAERIKDMVTCFVKDFTNMNLNMSNALCDALNSTLIFLSPTLCETLSGLETPRENCEKLAGALSDLKSDDAILPGNASTFLRTGIADLAKCYENLEHKPSVESLVENPNENNDQHFILYTQEGIMLEREIRKVESEAKFLFAINNFQKCGEECVKKCKDKSLNFKEKFFATNGRVVTEILKDLKNLANAIENCMEIVKELNDSASKEIQGLQHRMQRMSKAQRVALYAQSLTRQSEATIDLTLVVNMNVALFNVIKKYIRKPVALLDWPVIKEEKSPQTFHPIIGQPSQTKIDKTEKADFTTPIENNGQLINTRISAINSNGEVLVFAKNNESSSAIVRIAHDGICVPFWSLTDEKTTELTIPGDIRIMSISVDCNGCEDQERSHKACKNNVYVLATYTTEERLAFALFVIDVRGKLLLGTKLTCPLPRDKRHKPWGKIFCTKNKLVICDVYKGEDSYHLCDQAGELDIPLEFPEQKPGVISCVSSIPADDELVFMQPGKIRFYSITNQQFLDDLKIKEGYEVTAIAFNHVSNKVNLLCKSERISTGYHLMCHAKSGELLHRIKLNENLYDLTNVSLVSHPSGPVVLIDNKRVLYLQHEQKEN